MLHPVFVIIFVQQLYHKVQVNGFLPSLSFFSPNATNSSMTSQMQIPFFLFSLPNATNSSTSQMQIPLTTGIQSGI